RKAGELRGAIAILAGNSDSSRPREDLRRRLHALYASAQVFQLTPISEALQDAIGRLDDARDKGRALSAEELHSFGKLADRLSAIADLSAEVSTLPEGGKEREEHAKPAEGKRDPTEPFAISAALNPSARPSIRSGGLRRSGTMRGLGISLGPTNGSKSS